MRGIEFNRRRNPQRLTSAFLLLVPLDEVLPLFWSAAGKSLCISNTATAATQRNGGRWFSLPIFDAANLLQVYEGGCELGWVASAEASRPVGGESRKFLACQR